MTVLKKVKQEGDIEMYELDREVSAPPVYASTDKHLNPSVDASLKRDQEIQDERAIVEPGVYKKRVQLDMR